MTRLSRMIAIAGLVLLWCVAASAQDIRYNYLQGTDFTKYKTYKWVQIPNIQYPNSILDDQIKRAIDARVMASGLGSYNSFGMIATEAAWRTGDAWLDALLPYLAGNRDLLDRRIEATAPGARSMRLDATYLAWVDFSATGLPPEEVARRVKDRARIFASPGPQFGPGGETWLRFNFATPRPILEDALVRLEHAFSDLRARG